MAHNSRVLPWRALADNLKFIPSNPSCNGVTNLYPRFEPDQTKEFQTFVKAFSTVVDDCAIKERASYPDELKPIADDEVFISDTILNRIDEEVYKYRDPLNFQQRTKDMPSTFGDHTRQLPYYIETLADRQPANPISYPDLDGPLEMLKRLLLYDEMEPLLRLAVSPSIRFWAVWCPYKDDTRENGWKYVLDIALKAYLCLNVLYLKPELHTKSSPTRRCEATASSNKNDYRLTASYQRMVAACTWTRGNPYETQTNPYREFFGIPRGLIYTKVPYMGKLFGSAKFSDLMVLPAPTDGPEEKTPPKEKLSSACSNPDGTPPELTGDKPDSHRSWKEAAFPQDWFLCRSELADVVNILGKKGLPSELALEVLEQANYYPYCNLVVKDDPLHLDNREELGNFLTHCWKLIVRLDMLWKANGTCIDWDLEVADAIFNLWGIEQPQMVQRYYECYHNGEHGRWRWETIFV